jgi:molybdate transport system ATP-binding protein
VNPDSPSVRIELHRRIHAGLSVAVTARLACECGVLFGRSGCGKTTALRCIAGLVRPDAGRIELHGQVLYDSAAGVCLPIRRRRIGMVFQDDLLFPHLTVRENIQYGLDRWPRSERLERLDQMASLFVIGHLLDRRPDALSGGEKQRVGLARAIAPRPRLLLCDEPISAIDQEGRAVLVADLRRVQQAEQIPLLYVTHNIDEAIALGDRIFVMDGGRIIAEGAPHDVFTELRQLSVARLTRVRNIFSTTVESHQPAQGVTIVRIAGGPALRVPLSDAPVGSRATCGIRSDDILLAAEAVTGISAQNILPGRVSEIVRHGGEVEVLIDCGVRFVASVVAAAVESLDLQPGRAVHLIIKARSCHRLDPMSSMERA